MKHILFPIWIIFAFCEVRAELMPVCELPTVTDTIRFNNFEYEFEKFYVADMSPKDADLNEYVQYRILKSNTYHPNWKYEYVNKEEGFISAFLFAKPEVKSKFEIHFYPKAQNNDSLKIDLEYAKDTLSYKDITNYKNYSKFSEISKNNIYIQKINYPLPKNMIPDTLIASVKKHIKNQKRLARRDSIKGNKSTLLYNYNPYDYYYEHQSWYENNHYTFDFDYNLPYEDSYRAWITLTDKEFYIVIVLSSNEEEEFDKNLYHLCKVANSLNQINNKYDVFATIDFDKEKARDIYSDLIDIGFEQDDSKLLEKYFDVLAESYIPITKEELEKKPYFEKEAYKIYEEFFYPEVRRSDSVTDLGNLSYANRKYFLMQKKLDIAVVDDIDIELPNKKYSLLFNLRNTQHDTISSISINNFYPRLENDSRKLLSNSDRITKYFDDFLEVKRWDERHLKSNSNIFQLSYHRAEFLSHCIGIYLDPQTFEWIIGCRPIVNIMINKSFDKALMVNRFWYQGRIEILKKENGTWKLIYSETWASIS